MITAKRIFFLLLLIGFFAPGLGFAKKPNSTKSTITSCSGTIIDKATQEDLGGVYIYFEELQKGIYSGSDGKFNLEGIEPGTYNVTVKFISYRDKKITIKVEKAKDSLTKILLEPINP